MPTFALLSKLPPEATAEPGALNKAAEEVKRRIKELAGVKWIASYTTFGPYDVLDIFEAPNEEIAAKVSLIIRAVGKATTETWLVTPWDRFLEITKSP